MYVMAQIIVQRALSKISTFLPPNPPSAAFCLPASACPAALYWSRPLEHSRAELSPMLEQSRVAQPHIGAQFELALLCLLRFLPPVYLTPELNLEVSSAKDGRGFYL